MGLKFNLKGPIFEVDGAKIEFKRVSSSQVLQWELKNSVLKGRTDEERKQFAERAEKDISNWEFYTAEEKALLASSTSRFCVDHVVSVDNLIDDNGDPISYEPFDDETKLRFFDFLIENHDLSEWLSKYKAGTEKKS